MRVWPVGHPDSIIVAMRSPVPLARLASPMRRGLAALTAAALIVSACSGDDDDDDAEPSTTPAPERTTPREGTDPGEPVEPTYTFGFLGPGVGVLAELAVGQERGLTLAIEDINAAGGVLGGPADMFRWDEELEPDDGDDDEESTATTDEGDGGDGDEDAGRVAAALDDMAEQGADAVLGPVGSASAVELAPLVADRGQLACSASATAVAVTAGNDVRSFFRTAMRDDDTSGAVADRVMDVPEGEEPPTTVLILGRDDTYGAELVGDLAAQLAVRGATVETELYPPRRLEYDEEIDLVLGADPDVLVLASYTEGLELVDQLHAADFPLDRVVGLDGLAFPDLAELVAPDDPSEVDGLRVIRTTGDRAMTARLLAVEARNDVTVYGAQMYDCAVTIALAVIAADSADPAAVGAQVQAVTSDGRTCSTFAHCTELLAAGEDIDYTGPSGGLDIDDHGDISRALLTTSTVVEGELVDTATEEIDLIAEREQDFLAATIVTTQLQQALRILGYYDGAITGVFDEATADAVRALQRDLGVEETGEYDAATDAALRERLGAASGALHLAISTLQQELQELGFYDGPIDGRYSAATIAAVRAFQAALGVPQSGVLDAATLRAIYARGQQSATPPTTTTTPPTTTTAPPTTTAPAPPATTTAPPPVTTAPPPPPVTTPAPPPVTTAPPPATTVAPTTTEPTTTTEAAAPPTTEAAPPTPPPPPELPTMWEVVSGDPRFSTFTELLRSAGFDRDLSSVAPVFTVFAPTDAAFDAMDPDERAAWTDDPGRLASLLAYHGVDPDEGVLGADDLRTGPLRSIQGELLDVQVTGATTTVNGGELGTPTEASNGIVHPIDAVLIPPD
jgi:branched-chain amino acid transport system substrate-binding protein